eukprot:2845570-Alexandrium_andersonii.AAC.1
MRATHARPGAEPLCWPTEATGVATLGSQGARSAKNARRARRGRSRRLSPLSRSRRLLWMSSPRLLPRTVLRTGSSVL